MQCWLKSRDKNAENASMMRLLQRLVLCCALFLHLGQETSVAEPIIIKGRKPSSVQPQRRPGNSKTHRPQSLRESEAANNLSNAEGRLRVQTAKPSLTGFSLPRVRGQEVKLTEVYFDDILLQDPYSGLPLVEELDARAFGEVETHTGLAPYDLPSLNPIASLQFRSRPVVSPVGRLGLKADSRGGFGQWLQGEWPLESGEWFHSFRGYAAHHSAPGNELVFDNNRTPENLADDSLVRLRGNDRSHIQAVTFWNVEPPQGGRFTHWLRVIQVKGGVALPFLESAAREEIQSFFTGLSWKKRGWAGIDFTPKISYKRDAQSLDDSGADFLPFAERQGLQTQSGRLSLSLERKFGPVKTFAQTSVERVAIEKSIDDRSEKVDRLHGQLYFGLSRTPAMGHSGWMAEGKGQLGLLSDRRESAGDERSTSSRNLAQLGTTLGWQAPQVFFWGQASVFRRPPALVEEFGNGSTLEGNADLKTEQTFHTELGVGWEALQLTRLTFTVFRDQVANKVRFVSTSLNGAKALNLGKVNYLGAESTLQHKGSLIQGLVGVSYLQPTLVDEGRRDVPWTPRWLGRASLSLQLKSFWLSWSGRYKGRSFRDRGARVLLPPILTHSASVGSVLNFDSAFAKKVELLLRVDNLSDQKHMDAEVVGEGGVQRTAYSEVDGYPLPGRSLALSVQVEI